MKLNQYSISFNGKLVKYLEYLFASLAFLTNGNINEIAEILQESTNTITELFNKHFGPDMIQCF